MKPTLTAEERKDMRQLIEDAQWRHTACHRFEVEGLNWLSRCLDRIDELERELEAERSPFLRAMAAEGDAKALFFAKRRISELEGVAEAAQRHERLVAPIEQRCLGEVSRDALTDLRMSLLAAGYIKEST